MSATPLERRTKQHQRRRAIEAAGRQLRRRSRRHTRSRGGRPRPEAGRSSCAGRTSRDAAGGGRWRGLSGAPRHVTLGDRQREPGRHPSTDDPRSPTPPDTRARCSPAVRGAYISFPGDDVGAHNRLRRFVAINTPPDHDAVGGMVARGKRCKTRLDRQRRTRARRPCSARPATARGAERRSSIPAPHRRLSHRAGACSAPRRCCARGRERHRRW